MKVSMIAIVALTLVALVALAEAWTDYEPTLASSKDGNYKISDEASEQRARFEADERMIKEILEGILEHLQKDHNYKQGKYIMYVPKQKRTQVGPSSQDDAEMDRNKQHRIEANELEELRVV